MTTLAGQPGDFRAGYAHARSVAGFATDTLGLFWAVGPDAITYLQGILSQDIEGLTPGQAARSFLLEPRGKLDALLWVLRDEHRVGIITDAARQAAVIASLSRWRLRVDVEFSGDDRPVLDVWGPGDRVPGAAGGWREEQGVLVAELRKRPVRRRLVAGLGPQALEELGAVPIGRRVVDALRIEAGEPRMGIDVNAKTIPQETGLVPEAVSFTKGCFLGQELVARIDSRGRVNRHLRGTEDPRTGHPAGGRPGLARGKGGGTAHHGGGEPCAGSPGRPGPHPPRSPAGHPRRGVLGAGPRRGDHRRSPSRRLVRVGQELPVYILGVRVIMDATTTAEEAKAQALVWLEAFRVMSRFDWQRPTSTTISCEPLAGLPCYVMAVAAAGNGGYRPSLAFTVGTKGANGATGRGSTRRSKPAVLSQVRTCRSSTPCCICSSLLPGSRRNGVVVIFRSTFSAADITDVMSQVQDVAREHDVPDRRRLVMMVRELAENALYHSGEDGGVCKAGMIGDDQFVVEVRDEGRGYMRACWRSIRASMRHRLWRRHSEGVSRPCRERTPTGVSG